MKHLGYKTIFLSLYRKAIQIRQDGILGRVRFLDTGAAAVFSESPERLVLL